MFILNNKSINPYAPFTGPDGTRYPNLLAPEWRSAVGVVEIPDPTPPADYSEATYYRTEQEDAPYIVWTRKSDEQIRAAQLAAIPAISPRQIRQALTRAGLRQLVETAVAAGDQDLKDWWEFATTFERTNEHVVAMGQALGQTEEQMDALWALGASL